MGEPAGQQGVPPILERRQPAWMTIDRWVRVRAMVVVGALRQRSENRGFDVDRFARAVVWGDEPVVERSYVAVERESGIPPCQQAWAGAP